MAKMFYNLKETASRLGLGEEEVTKMVEQGKLQQFRDRDKLMFKRDQVDELASMKETTSLEDEPGADELSLDDTVDALATKTDKIDLLTDDDAQATASGEGTALNLELTSDEVVEEVPVDPKGETDELELEEAAGSGALSLSDTTGIALSTEPGASSARTAPLNAEAAQETAAGSMELEFEEAQEPPKPAPKIKKDSGKSKAGTIAGATGISVFDSQELEPADSMARTQVTKAFVQETEEDLNLESVGSGSGLLDLTREADDTSLGAVELLDDIAPAGESAPGGTVGGTIGGSVPGSATGIFEGAAEAEAAAAATSGTLAAEPEAMGEESELATPVSYAAAEGEDPVGDAMGGATLLGVFAVLVIAFIISVGAIQGQVFNLTQQFTTLADKSNPQKSLLAMLGVLLFLNILLLVVGIFVGKSRAKRA